MFDNWPLFNNLPALTIVGIVGGTAGLYCLLGTAVYTKKAEREVERYTKFNTASIAAQNNDREGFDYLLKIMDKNAINGSVEQLAYSIVFRITQQPSIYRFLSEQASYKFPIELTNATLQDYTSNYDSVPNDAKVMYLNWCLGSSPKITRREKYDFLMSILDRSLKGKENCLPLILVAAWYLEVYIGEDKSKDRPHIFPLDYHPAYNHGLEHLRRLDDTEMKK
jgi:hypothetical protein